MENGTITQQEREDYEAPGPFSLVSYLKAMLKGDFYDVAGQGDSAEWGDPPPD